MSRLALVSVDKPLINFAALHKILHSLCLTNLKMADTASCENSKLTTLYMLASGDKLLGGTEGLCVLGVMEVKCWHSRL